MLRATGRAASGGIRLVREEPAGPGIDAEDSGTRPGLWDPPGARENPWDAEGPVGAPQKGKGKGGAGG